MSTLYGREGGGGFDSARGQQSPCRRQLRVRALAARADARAGEGGPREATLGGVRAERERDVCPICTGGGEMYVRFCAREGVGDEGTGRTWSMEVCSHARSCAMSMTDAPCPEKQAR